MTDPWVAIFAFVAGTFVGGTANSHLVIYSLKSSRSHLRLARRCLFEARKVLDEERHAPQMSGEEA